MYSFDFINYFRIRISCFIWNTYSVTRIINSTTTATISILTNHYWIATWFVIIKTITVGLIKHSHYQRCIICISKNVFSYLFSVHNTISLHVIINMFNGSTFKKILLPSLCNVNDYVAHIDRKYADLERNNRICRSGEKRL